MERTWKLSAILRGRRTLEEVERLYYYGVIADHVFTAYCKVWRSSAFRFSELYAIHEGAVSREACDRMLK